MNRKLKFFVAITICLTFSIYTNAQTKKENCVCCSASYNQFDFWLGNWNVYDTLGSKTGENHIISMQDHCVLQENWKSKNSTGTSYNYYNASDSTWNQIWVDNRGNPLVLKGKYLKGKMILKSVLTKGQKVKEYYNQITWHKMSDESVVQTWEIFDRNDNKLAQIFKGIYRRKD